MEEAQVLPQTDYSQYKNWPKVVAPSGQTYYAIPETGYLYDPFLSSAKGRPVLFTDPRAKAAERDKALKAQKDAASPLGQLAGIGGSIGGVLLGQHALSALGPTTAAEKLAEQQLANTMASNTTAAGTAQAAQVAQPAADAAGAFTQAATSPSVGATQIGTTVDGSAIMSDGTTLAADSAATMPYQSGLTVGNVLSAAAIAKGTYDSARAFERGGEGIRTGTTQIGAGVGSLLGGPIGAGAGALAGNIVGYGLQDNKLKNNAALALMTGGLALPLGFARDHLMRKSTKQLVGERWNDLKKEGITGVEEAYAAGHVNADDSKWDFNEAQERAKVEPSGFRHVYGNLKTFGNDWSTYRPEQQDAIVKGLIDAGLYESKKGDVLIKNEDEARKIKDQVLAAGTPTEAAPQAAPQRSSTISAGIGKDGKPLNYSKGQTITQQQAKELAKRLDARYGG